MTASTAGGRNIWSKRAFWAMLIGLVALPLTLWPLFGLVIGAVAIQQGLTAREEWSREDLRNRWQAQAAVVLGAVAAILSIVLWVLSAALGD